MFIETTEAYQALPGHDLDTCSYCGRSAYLPMVIWQNNTSFIQFHPDCAANFLIVLAHDIHEYKQSSQKPLKFGLSPDEERKIYEDVYYKDPHHNHFPVRHTRLTIPAFRFINGGSEKAHIQREGESHTRCGHLFKKYHVMDARELEDSEVCDHCFKQGGGVSYPTGEYKMFNENTQKWERVNNE